MWKSLVDWSSRPSARAVQFLAALLALAIFFQNLFASIFNEGGDVVVTISPEAWIFGALGAMAFVLWIMLLTQRKIHTKDLREWSNRFEELVDRNQGLEKRLNIYEPLALLLCEWLLQTLRLNSSTGAPSD